MSALNIKQALELLGVNNYIYPIRGGQTWSRGVRDAHRLYCPSSNDMNLFR